MQVQESALLVIPNNFAANLWHVVNDPDIPAIVWDSQGEVVIIDKYSIEKQVLSPSKNTLNSGHAFGAISFLSFIRKLYAYGFKKAPHPPAIHPNIYQFFNPNFKKNRPELLSLVSRSAPKYRRIHKSDPRAKFLPKDNAEKKDVCIQCENGEETLQEGDKLHQRPIKPVLIMTPEIHGNNKGAAPPGAYKRPQVPQNNYFTSLVPYLTPGRYPNLNAGVSNMVYRPGHFVPALCWYRQDPMAPGFCTFYQMGCPGNTVQVPPMYPIEPVSSFAQKMPCSSTSVLKMTPLNRPCAVAQHISIISGDGVTSICPQITTVAEAGEKSQNTTTEK